jgi:ABC-type nitrate/sulfonate/bicarbonate transport system ATPase subunit
MIKFESVSKSFADLKILNEISFEIKNREIVALQGPSGSGKTTLLKLIAGILKPDSGTLTVPVAKIGFVFQDHRLLPWRTARDNISLVLKASGTGEAEAREKAGLWLDRLGLNKFHDYFPSQLSGGMVQRVSIARAFALEPELMLMDEPFSSLDADLADALIKELSGVLREYRTTTVYVTHDRLEAISLADRIFLLERGKLKITPVMDRKGMARDYLNDKLKEIKLPD